MKSLKNFIIHKKEDYQNLWTFLLKLVNNLNLLMIFIAEAYRNKTVYEYFKDCPNKPKFTHDDPASYYLQITTGGPIKAKRKQPERLQEIVARAALKIQRAIRRWRKKK